MFFYETGESADPFGAAAQFPEIASDLSYTAWHTIDIYIDFVDGLNADTTGNDCVTVFLDGSLIHTGSTWESFYRWGGAGTAPLNAPDLPQRQAVDSLNFYTRGTAYPANSGDGLYFDDVVVDNAVSPASCVTAIPIFSGRGLVVLAVLLLMAAMVAMARGYRRRLTAA